MKRKFTLFSFLMLAVVSAASFASARDVGASFLWSPATRSASPAITSDVGKLTSVFGQKGFDLDALAVVSKTPTDAPVLGYALVSRYQVANEALLMFGPALTAVQGHKMSFGVLVGVSLRF